MATKKVGSAGRFKARYGVGIRKRLIKVEEKQRKASVCQNCGFEKVKRQGTGIYHCKKCGLQFAGGAFLPQTMSGALVKKMVSQKSFLPSVEELISLKEGEEAKPEKKAGKKAGKKAKKAEKEGKKEKKEAKEKVKAEEKAEAKEEEKKAELKKEEKSAEEAEKKKAALEANEDI